MIAKSILRAIVSSIAVFAATTPVWSQTAKDVFPAIVFLQGHHVKHETVNGRDVEVWIRDKNQEHPKPFKLPASGTGFLVKDMSHLYLVTVQHLAVRIPDEPNATMLGPNDVPLTYALSKLTRNISPKWTMHGEADIAVLPIFPPDDFKAAIRAIPYSNLASRNATPALDEFLTTVGFPLKLGTKDKFSPIVKVTHPASSFFRYPRFDNNIEATFFILDDPSVAGFSGAPVFRLPSIRMGGIRSPQGAFQCVGVIHGTFNDKTGGKFAAVIPSSYVAETIRMAAKEQKIVPKNPPHSDGG